MSVLVVGIEPFVDDIYSRQIWSLSAGCIDYKVVYRMQPHFVLDLHLNRSMNCSLNLNQIEWVLMLLAQLYVEDCYSECPSDDGMLMAVSVRKRKKKNE